MTDALLKRQTKEPLARELQLDSYTVWVKPELVVEIAFNDLQESSRAAAAVRAGEGVSQRQGRRGRGDNRGRQSAACGTGDGQGELEEASRQHPRLPLRDALLTSMF